MRDSKLRYTFPMSVIAVVFTLVLYSLSSTLSVFSRPPVTARPAIAIAWTPVEKNADWMPYFESFEGVEMALVPIGCFIMGSEDGADDEKPVSRQCLNQPFWIDKTEVTNAQFARFIGVAGRVSYWTGPQRPRERITWFEARDFCAARGAGLPTEREWEYAARGPDSLVYPWGNTFDADNVVYEANADDKTANVGSRPGGVSWVGALDMSGNVWEWVSSAYQSYPYRTDDGRDDNVDRTGVLRVLRGGSWHYLDTNVRAPNRNGVNPALWSHFLGFRCARSY